MKKYFLFLFIGFSILHSEESIESVSVDKNEIVKNLKRELKDKYELIQSYWYQNIDDDEYKELLKDVKIIKKQITDHQNKYISWVKNNNDSDINYDFWDQGEMTLSSFVMEYGSNDYLYLIPNEISSLKINICSYLPILSEDWDELISLVLQQNGIGIKQLNPYLKQLYIYKHDLSNVNAITSNIESIKNLPSDFLIFFVLNVPIENIKSLYAFFDRFSDPKQVHVQIVGSKIIIIAAKDNVERLLNLYEATWEGQKKSIKTISLTKLQAVDAEKILKGFFHENDNKMRPSLYSSTTTEDIQIFPIIASNQIVIIGSEDTTESIRSMIENMEAQIEDPQEMTVFWYTCKHSDPEDIAKILEKVYASLSNTSFVDDKKDDKKDDGADESVYNPNKGQKFANYFPVLPITPVMAEPGRIPLSTNGFTPNFIVDNKTGSILMVVKKDDLEKLKAVLKKLDVPKKMVQLEVLLVEKKLHERKQSGINILKIGTGRNTRETAMSFDANPGALRKGLLDFILTRPKGHWPAFDFVMSFLMAQDDIKINASPSVLAINQTPATISIVEELSINNGAIELDTSTGVRIEKSFTRAQFGITIVFTPTIHICEIEEGEKSYVTLNTNITFDTTQNSQDDRPPVTRRHIENEVRIADGETIILGGLRKLASEDNVEKFPFISEIPGIGKLFGTTKLAENTTEMFIFITPKIINENSNLEELIQESLDKRPGDVPEFLKNIELAKRQEKSKILNNTLNVLFDNQ